ncbi:hypothetical protein B5M42_013970 [Paenibacillus athensensis]|uniref:Uncharacterized protein n=1 Tax=Paenibacillus athensensis TaxID=1967502 RepID=A0A4Y8Q007_9BACL|nr:hypothetical protein [Paenibacillus athensensis]MCD1259939.1 hypothetical protein [Paenibacillus athensensis]
MRGKLGGEAAAMERTDAAKADGERSEGADRCGESSAVKQQRAGPCGERIGPTRAAYRVIAAHIERPHASNGSKVTCGKVGVPRFF